MQFWNRNLSWHCRRKGPFAVCCRNICLSEMNCERIICRFHLPRRAFSFQNHAKGLARTCSRCYTRPVRKQKEGLPLMETRSILELKRRTPHFDDLSLFGCGVACGEPQHGTADTDPAYRLYFGAAGRGKIDLDGSLYALANASHSTRKGKSRGAISGLPSAAEGRRTVCGCADWRIPTYSVARAAMSCLHWSGKCSRWKRRARRTS